MLSSWLPTSTPPSQSRLLLSLAVCLIICGNTVALAQDDPLPMPEHPIGANHHAWARFGVGSWKLVKISREIFDKDGKLESTTIQEGKTTLIAVGKDHFTLQEEVTLEIAGKRFKSATRTITRGLNNETDGQTVNSKMTGQNKVVISRQEYLCQTHQITVSDGKSKCVSTLHYSPEIQPHVLKRETVCTDMEGKQTNYKSFVEVLALDMPHRVLTEVKPAAHIKTVHIKGNVSTVTLEVSCASVPGNIVAHTAKQVGPDGRLAERSTLELMDYRVVAKPAEARALGRPRLFGKRRVRGQSR